MIVRLTPEQELDAAGVGFRRREAALRTGARSRHLNGSNWEAHIEGACAELAASIALGLPWTGRDYLVGQGMAKPAGDIGTRTEVKWVGRNAVLRVDPRDDLDRPYVLVTGYSPELDVIGWAFGHEVVERGSCERWPERTVHTFGPDQLRTVA